jgi:hypothetical protein
MTRNQNSCSEIVQNYRVAEICSGSANDVSERRKIAATAHITNSIYETVVFKNVNNQIN